MKAKTSFVLVGLFVLLLSTALIAVVLWLTTGGPPKDYDYYVTYMTESVSGLSVDAAVKYKGVSVGRVRELGLDPDNPERVRIKMVVLEGTPVKQDTVAELAAQGLTGLMHVNLTGGSQSAPNLTPPPGSDTAEIPSRPSLFGRLDQGATDLLGSLMATTDRANAVLSDRNVELIGDVLANTAVLSERLAERSGDIEALLNEARQTIRAIRTSTERLPKVVEQVNATAAALEKMALSLATTADTLEASSADLNATIVTSGADLRRFTSVALPEATRTVSELRATANSLRRISETIEADPSQLVFGAPERVPGPGE